MRTEHSIGAVLFHDRPEGRVFLLLHYPQGHWDFPKGHVEAGEDELTTLTREINEETGLTDIEIVPGFREESHYTFQNGDTLIFKIVSYHVVRVFSSLVKLSREHRGFQWGDAHATMDSATFRNSKVIFEKALLFLKHV
ncbi:MAG: NUDIX domain-containing protein [Parcubacteria group bacterium]|nr:NUDIX domain-containing protein [Parcubacteria group bacterium]